MKKRKLLRRASVRRIVGTRRGVWNHRRLFDSSGSEFKCEPGARIERRASRIGTAIIRSVGVGRRGARFSGLRIIHVRPSQVSTHYHISEI
jgi:hypothetical protein